jgi:hypothetical protein
MMHMLFSGILYLVTIFSNLYLDYLGSVFSKLYLEYLDNVFSKLYLPYLLSAIRLLR